MKKVIFIMMLSVCFMCISCETAQTNEPDVTEQPHTEQGHGGGPGGDNQGDSTTGGSNGR